jgi:UDP-3-O-[3-hydroxymyristoyl] glucosamine N-acyltransferase
LWFMDDVRIGPKAYIGKASVIHAGVRIPAGTVLPDRSVIRSEADLVAFRNAA